MLSKHETKPRYIMLSPLIKIFFRKSLESCDSKISNESMNISNQPNQSRIGANLMKSFLLPFLIRCKFYVIFQKNLYCRSIFLNFFLPS